MLLVNSLTYNQSLLKQKILLCSQTHNFELYPI